MTTTATTTKNVNPDLKRERSNATFDVERITNLLDGGRDRTERRRFLEQVIERDPTGIFSNDDNIYLHRTDRHKRGMAKGVRLIEICRKLGIGDGCNGQITDSKDFQLILEAVADDVPLRRLKCTNIIVCFEMDYLFMLSASLGDVPTEHS